jgi:hypothetical protein
MSGPLHKAKRVAGVPHVFRFRANHASAAGTSTIDSLASLATEPQKNALITYVFAEGHFLEGVFVSYPYLSI